MPTYIGLLGAKYAIINSAGTGISITDGVISATGVGSAVDFKLTLNASGVAEIAIANAANYRCSQPLFDGNPSSQADIYREDSDANHITFVASAGAAASGKLIQGNYWMKVS